jgi:hypothetical protein
MRTHRLVVHIRADLSQKTNPTRGATLSAFFFEAPSSSPLTAHSGGAAAGAAAVAAAAGRAGSCSAEQASAERDGTLIIIIIDIIIIIIIIVDIIIIIVECDGHGAQGRRRHLAGHSAAADQRRLHARGLQRMLFLVRPLRFAF